MTAVLDRRQLDSAAGQERAGLETARRKIAGQCSWTALLDRRQLDSAAGQETTEQADGREAAGQRCWTCDSWTVLLDVTGQERRCWMGDSWTALLDRR